MDLAHRVAVEDQFASVHPQQMHDQPRQCGLAAARFADQAERFALQHGEGDAVDGLQCMRLAQPEVPESDD
jgi:hypothetical protein